MKTIILYYSLGGTSKKQAHSLVQEYNGAVVEGIKEQKQRSVFTAFIPGCVQAMQRKAAAICPLEHDLAEFERIVMVMPIWAGNPAPAFNAALKLVPAGREVELYFCSGSGAAPKSEPGTKQMVAQRGCILTGYHDVKADAVSD